MNPIDSNNLYKIFTYLFVDFLKRTENEDYFDYSTNFNPFSGNLSKKKQINDLY